MILYRFILFLTAPFFALRLMLRDDARGRRERLGLDDHNATATCGQIWWMHAASNGELTAARPLIQSALFRDPKLQIVLTCNSVTGRDLATRWGLERVQVRLAPLDYGWALRQFLGTWQPDALIIIENELWPNRIAALRRQGRPVIVLSARMSAKSARMWQRFPRLAARVFSAISLLSAQDSASESRFLDLGMPRDRVIDPMNLKSHFPDDTSAGQAMRPRLKRVLDRSLTVLAASTHAGEELPLLTGFAAARVQQPDLALILAPRHPRRRDEIETLLKRLRLPFVTRSRGQEPGADTAVYLADTLGEMPLWYSLAGITFVGGSLVDKGGHTPFEPASHGSALLHGPHLSNFSEIYAVLDREGGATLITGADEFAKALTTLTSKAQRDMAARATNVITGLQQGGGLDPVFEEMADILGNPRLRGPET